MRHSLVFLFAYNKNSKNFNQKYIFLLQALWKTDCGQLTAPRLAKEWI